MLLRLALWTILAAVALIAETKADIQALDDAWIKAILARDAKALNTLLADDLVYAHSTGIIDTKASYIEKIKSGRQVYQTLTQRNPTVRLYGNSAVTHSWARVTGVNQDGKFDDKIMLLHVWVKQDGKWSLAGHQTTRVASLP